jgi:primosomal protein N'
MSKLYNIVVSKPNFPFDSLTYSSEHDLADRQLCVINIKDTPCYGLVLGTSTIKREQIKNLKNISEQLPYSLTPKHFEFLNKIGFLTFNSLSNLLTIAMKPYEYLVESKKYNHTQIQSGIIIEKILNTDLDYIISQNWTNEIYNQITSYNKISNTLVIFPEKNILTKTDQELEELFKLNKNTELQLHNLNCTGQKKLISSYTNLLNYNLDSKKTNIFLGNKNTLFYPLDNINQIIIVDEANPSYVSEHRIYYDARELAFWASKIYQFKLTFISLLPSIRFLEFAKDQVALLPTPKVNIKHLDRIGRQDDFENILNEINNSTLYINNEDE